MLDRFRRRKRSVLSELVLSELESAADAVDVEVLRQEAVAALDRSMELATIAEEALKSGKPVDCPEVREFQGAQRDALAAMQRFTAR